LLPSPSFHPNPLLYGNLTPFIPLSLKGEGEEILERGRSPPLLLSLPLPFIREGGQGDGFYYLSLLT
jgi:hypothetical protein